MPWVKKQQLITFSQAVDHTQDAGVEVGHSTTSL